MFIRIYTNTHTDTDTHIVNVIKKDKGKWKCDEVGKGLDSRAQRHGFKKDEGMITGKLRFHDFFLSFKG